MQPLVLLAIAIILFFSSPAQAACPGIGCGSTSAVYAKEYGAICDGGSHPLSGVYGSLGAAQAVYPFVTSLTQQLDYAALKQASNVAFGADGSEHGTSSPNLNARLYLPSGICYIGADTWTIRSLDGGAIEGAGTATTKIRGDSIVLQFDGLWYSQLKNLFVQTTSSSAVVALDIDGNVPGHPYATIGVQGDRFDGIFVDGGNSTYAVAVCRQGGSGGQCSEMTWDNFHGSNASFAVYYQNGFNAIDNVFLGGDMQVYSKDGIYLLAGSVKVYGMSFESTTGYTQLANSGCDIEASGATAGDIVVVSGTRSESLCLYHGGAQLADLRGIQQADGIGAWAAGTYILNQIVKGADSSGTMRAWRVTTAGTTAGVQPTWPSSGTITDGSVVWTFLPYLSVNVGPAGTIDLYSSVLNDTSTVLPGIYQNVSGCGSGQAGVFGGGTDDAGSTPWSGSVTEGTSATGCTIVLAIRDQMMASGTGLGSIPPVIAPPRCVVSSPTGTILTGYSLTHASVGFWNLTWTHASASNAKVVWQCSRV
jgi:hypothetical protein